MSWQGLTAHLPKEDFKTRRSSEAAILHPLHLVTDSAGSAEHSESERLAQPALVPTIFHEDWWLDACRRVLTSALGRKQGRIIAARNANGDITAANFCAWDNETSFYVLSTRSKDAGNGATSLLIWEAIQHAVLRGLIFDFAGLGTRGSVLLYSGFGASVSPRFVALRSSGFARLVADARALLTHEFYFF